MFFAHVLLLLLSSRTGPPILVLFCFWFVVRLILISWRVRSLPWGAISGNKRHTVVTESWVYATGRQEDDDGKTLECDNRYMAIPCVFVVIITWHYCFLVFYEKIYLREGEVWRKVFSNKIIVTHVTQGLPSSFLSRPLCVLCREMVTLQKHCWMANAAVGQEKQRDYIIQKSNIPQLPVHCLPSSKVVFIPCDRFSGHNWNNHSFVHSPSIYEILEHVYGKAK